MGLALEASRKLASFIETRPAQKQLAPNRIQAVTKIGIPEPAQFFNLDPRRLNAMSVDERRQVIESWKKKNRDGSFEMIEIEEKLELVKEGDEWRIFLNWAAGVKIPFRLALANAADLDVALSKSEVVIQPGDLFEIFLKIKNRSDQPVVARIGHLVEPREVTNFLDFVECGFLLPITLQPGKEQEYSARYLLRGGLPEGVHQLNLTYDFRLLKYAAHPVSVFLPCRLVAFGPSCSRPRRSTRSSADFGNTEHQGARLCLAEPRRQSLRFNDLARQGGRAQFHFHHLHGCLPSLHRQPCPAPAHPQE